MEVTALRQPTGDDGGDLGSPTAFILPTTSPIAWVQMLTLLPVAILVVSEDGKKACHGSGAMAVRRC
jgi:hypothetical protein